MRCDAMWGGKRWRPKRTAKQFRSHAKRKLCTNSNAVTQRQVHFTTVRVMMINKAHDRQSLLAWTALAVVVASDGVVGVVVVAGAACTSYCTKQMNSQRTSFLSLRPLTMNDRTLVNKLKRHDVMWLSHNLNYDATELVFNVSHDLFQDQYQNTPKRKRHIK